MPFLLPLLGGLLLRLTPALISAVLKAFGVSVLTFAGMTVAIDQAKDIITSNLSGMPALAIAILGLLKFDVAVNIIFAAVAGRITLNTLSGSFTKLALKK